MALALVLGGAYGLSQAPLAPVEYAAADSCAGCHGKIWETYRQTAMGRSFARVSAANVPPGGSYFHPPSESYFSMTVRDGKYFQRRHQLDRAGRTVNVMEKRIDYAMGSGNHSLAFLHRTDRGTLIELPLAWYSEKGGSWAMNPGYDRADHEGFRRKIGYDCMYCHNGYPRIPAGHDAPFAEPVYVEPMPEGIDCQRCHGPGGAHVRLARGGAPAEGIRKAMLNPARLSGERRDEVCMQCHLETTSFPLPNSLQRYDKGPFSFRPGQRLSDYWLFFDHAPGSGREDKFEFVNAVYRMRKSKCFLESKETLRCTTCHNPHETPRSATHFDGACRQCHAAAFDRRVAAGQHTKAGGCADCHMPKRRTEDVVHAVATDHLIQRPAPGRDLLAALAERRDEYRGEVTLYYPPALPPAPDNELYLALAQVAQKSNLAKGTERLAAAVRKSVPRRAEFYYELAEAWRSRGDLAKAILNYREALRRNATFVPGLRALGAALRTTGDFAGSRLILERAVAAGPNQGSNWHELGMLFRAMGKDAEALQALRKAVTLDPETPEFQSNLAVVLSAAGDRAQAEAAFREAIRLQPDYADAHGNLANLLAAGGGFTEAREHFETALRLRPGDATAHYNFAMALGRARLYEEAEREFAAALRADAGHLEARERLAEMLMAKGQLSAAVVHYRELVRLRPESGRALLGLGAALAMSGDVPGGRVFLQRAAGSTDVEAAGEARRILKELEGR